MGINELHHQKEQWQSKLHSKSSGENFSSSEGAEQAFSNNLVYKILALIFRKDQASPLKPVSQDQCQPTAGKAQMRQARILLEYSPETIIGV